MTYSSPAVRGAARDTRRRTGKPVPLVRVCGGFPAVFARADESEFALLDAARGGTAAVRDLHPRPGEPGQSEVRALLAQIVRAWQEQAPGCQLAVKAALLGIVAVCAQYGRLEGRHHVRPGRGLQGAAADARSSATSASTSPSRSRCRRSQSEFRPVAAVFQHVFPGKLRPDLHAAHQLPADRAGGASAARDRSAGHGGRASASASTTSATSSSGSG